MAARHNPEPINKFRTRLTRSENLGLNFFPQKDWQVSALTAIESLIESESSRIHAWLVHVARFEGRYGKHVLCIVDLRSPLGFEVASAATDSEHAAAHLGVLLSRDETPGLVTCFELPHSGESRALRYVARLLDEHGPRIEGDQIAAVVVDEHDSIALGSISSDRRSSRWGQLSWLVVFPGREPEVLPGQNDVPW